MARIALATSAAGLRDELIRELDFLISVAKGEQNRAHTVRDARYYKGRTHALMNYREQLATLWVQHGQHSSVSGPDGSGGTDEAGHGLPVQDS